MALRVKKALAITVVVLLWLFVPVARVLFLGAGLVWLLHGAGARVLRVSGIHAFRARYEASAFAVPKRKRLALRLAPPALLFLLAALFFASAMTQAQTYTSEILVESGFPAQQAGMLNGDRIVSVDGTPVSTFEEVSDRLREAPAAAPVSLEVKRGDALLRLTVHRTEEGKVGIRPTSTVKMHTTAGAFRSALFVTVSTPWKLVRLFFSPTPPETMLVGVAGLTQRGGAMGVLAGLGATFSALWLPFLVLGLALFFLGERAAPPKDTESARMTE